jgi:hypothetical protein
MLFPDFGIAGGFIDGIEFRYFQGFRTISAPLSVGCSSKEDDIKTKFRIKDEKKVGCIEIVYTLAS